MNCTMRLSVLFLVFAFLCAPVCCVAAQRSPELQEALDTHLSNPDKIPEAIELYTQIIAKDPKNAEAYNWRGHAYYQLSELDKALADFNKAIEIAPTYADAYNNKGLIELRRDQYQAATQSFAKAFESEKTFAEAHYNMGIALEKLKRYTEASQEYSRYLQVKPNAPDRLEITAKLDELSKAGPGVAPPPPRPAPRAGANRPGQPAANMQLKTPTGQDFAAAMAAQKAAEPASLLVSLIIHLLFAIPLFIIARNTETPLPWLAFIPLANQYLMTTVARQPLWTFIALFAPSIVGILAGIMMAVSPGLIIIALILMLISLVVVVVAWWKISMGMAEAVGATQLWGILMFIPCTSPIALIYFALMKH